MCRCGSIKQLFLSFQVYIFCKSRVSVVQVGGKVIVPCVCVIFLKSKVTLTPWYERGARFETAFMDFEIIYVYYRVRINEKVNRFCSQILFLMHVISRLPTWVTSSLFGEDMAAFSDVSGLYTLLWMRAEQECVNNQTVYELITIWVTNESIFMQWSPFWEFNSRSDSVNFSVYKSPPLRHMLN